MQKISGLFLVLGFFFAFDKTSLIAVSNRLGPLFPAPYISLRNPGSPPPREVASRSTLIRKTLAAQIKIWTAQCCQAMGARRAHALV